MGNRYKGLWTLKAKLLKEDTPVLYKNVSGKRVYVLMVKCGNPIFEFGDGVIEEAESFYAKSSDVKDIDSRLLTVESVLDIDKKTRKSKVIAKIKKDQKGIKEGLIEEQKKSDVIFVWLAVLTILIAGILYFVIRRRLTPTGDDNATQEPPGKDEGPEILLNGSKTPTKRPKTPPKTPEEIVVTIPSPIEELNEKLPKETPKGSGPSIKPPPEESKTPIKKPETIPEGDEIEDKSDDTSTEPIPVGPSQEQPPPEEPETPAAEKQTEPTPKEPFGEEVVMEQDETEVTPGDEKEVVLEEDPAKTEKRKEYERKNGGKKKKHGKGKNRR